MGVQFEWPADAGYERFVTEHARTLLRLAVMLTGNRYDADDVLQDAVISVAARWHSVNPDAALGYLRTAVTRKAIDLSRRRVHGRLDDVSEQATFEVGYLRSESDAEFVRILQGLPERQRAVLVVRYWSDADDATIARTPGCSVQTVRSQASRALAKLRTRLGELVADGEVGVHGPY